MVQQSRRARAAKSKIKGEQRDMANLEGKKAPAFTLEGSDGKKHSLEDYKGKTVVLYFIRRTIRRDAPRRLAAFAIRARR
jgi:cytochrome oxidase Cu insertion factor (SCO1/SenC/PrrC family)